MYLIGFATVTALAICFGDFVCAYGNRQKKQLSPALQLEDNINSLCVLMNWDINVPLEIHHMQCQQWKFHDNLDDLLSLQNIGKRPALSPADEFARQVDAMQHLTAAGKKRSLSPAIDFQQQVELPHILMDAGR
ncbi:hypothetical protein WUBG_18389 [Wuchereria bancrofti]|uniref:Uncharacterized protein n=1 Tax=Wuchereria bancrofti TaxID=6293 RepID=J9E1C4_WUCBA|nr:hypothetical protein WUBG_18389 [Wuchereria bancrofti]